MATSKPIVGSAVNNGGSVIFAAGAGTGAGVSYGIGGKIRVTDSDTQAKGPVNATGADGTTVYSNGTGSEKGDGTISTGRAGKPKSYGTNYSVSDSYLSRPSGTTLWGQPTWGDGQTKATTTWAADQEKTTGGEGSYAKQMGQTGFDYLSLTP